MKRVLRVYTELHSLFDYRRGLVQWLITEDKGNDELRRGEGDALWDLHFAKNYKERRMDRYEFPHFDLTDEKFKAALKDVSLTNFLMYYPTNFYRMFMEQVIGIEHMGDTPLEFTGVEIYINVNPYKFDTETLIDLRDAINSRFRGRYEVHLIDENPKELTARYYSQFNHVFKYDILLGDYEWFSKSLESDPIPNTTFYVPDLYLRESKEIKGLPRDVIFNMSMTLAASVRLIPVAHKLYDYEEA